jgi:Ca2+-binding EF-hand superfamily protein
VFLSKILVGYKITGADFKGVTKALDVNGNGKISQQEFLDVFKTAQAQVVGQEASAFEEEDDISGD